MADDVTLPEANRLAPAADEVWPLWRQGVPGPQRDLPPEARFPSTVVGGRETVMVRNVSAPALHVFRPTVPANGAGIIVCPGGGWRVLAWEHEGEDLARRLADRGFCAFVLKYRLLRTPADTDSFVTRAAALAARLRERLTGAAARRSLAAMAADPNVIEGRRLAAEDGRRALALVRERAGELGVRPDRIGMAGFSAGAYLTMDVALDPGGPPLAFAAPIYGGDIGAQPLPEDAPPLFAVAAQDDTLFVPASRALFDRWTDAGLPAELHVFPRGGHGFGLARQGLPVDAWPNLFDAWLDGLRLSAPSG
jgi:acetyl esterase/lipase